MIPELQELREQVYEACIGIFRSGLVTMHSGNASGADRGRGVVLIKPSGVDYEKLTPSMLVAVDLYGNRMTTGEAGDRLKPSVDLPHHLYLYRSCPDIGGIVHTHSNYATSFALLGRPLPPYLTAMADEFGGEIPCATYTGNQGDNIGRAIVQARNDSPAVLLANHGVFAFAETVTAAFKAAVMLEDVSKTCHLSLLLGTPEPLPAHEVRQWFDRYHTAYGQKQPFGE
ncbi:MAG TPA: class II aldolase/adducin family protein [Alloacidobacterium sp.]|jgi:L-ribulose-5-phosphate 4-epimerase|nr:class II aldolase/adducin family protein [Alloacidobacterium sp.]